MFDFATPAGTWRFFDAEAIVRTPSSSANFGPAVAFSLIRINPEVVIEIVAVLSRSLFGDGHMIHDIACFCDAILPA